MTDFIQVLKDYFAEHPLNHGDADSVLDLIYWHYTENNLTDNNATKEQFRKLRSLYGGLSPKEFDSVFQVVCDLCIQHERRSFILGLQLGAALIDELNSPPT